ncbi:MAG: alpha/beta fold hydrolase, partial [Candidatus Aenigmarchaeota archaeon]|nr:alpha/beta fold hydrolase [Candidatus Aenigmarchaeota archaeon]
MVTPTTSSDGTVAGEWGLSGKPVSIRASYYLDAYLEGKQYIIVPTKSETIDTYSLRLRDVISVVKERTGKQKVNIVAHSMGGLVARRYIQIFGDKDVNKLIMLATPNYGLAGRASDFCPLFGEQKECQDMQRDSLFLNRLNDPSR